MLSPEQKRPQTWQEALEMITRCPICNHGYPATAAKLCVRDARASKVHLTCQTCGAFALALIVPMNRGLSSIGMITDLSYADTERLAPLGPIETDELITAYQFWQEQNSTAAVSNNVGLRKS